MTEKAHFMFKGLCFILLLAVSACDEPEVTLTAGRVRGLKLVSAVNKIYYSFQGIPYAAPPIEKLRFKAPQPPRRWNGTLEAFAIPPACSQPWRKVKFPEKYSEDCLYINVFTPHLKPPGHVLMPVMVWIHGGKHYQGSSTSFKYGADFLVTENVVVVTFNYRLGVFGYLNLNTKGAQGNAASKDMVAALRWVQKEICQFGGDPNKVTIFGGSSGGQDVNCLYLSPMAKGLFHRAISQSSQHCSSEFHSDTLNASVRIAEMMGCASPDADATVACLRDATAQVLAERQMFTTTAGPGEHENLFLTTVEEDHGEEIFFPVPAQELLKKSHSNIPYLIGMNSDEGLMELKDPKDHPTQFSDFERDFEYYLPTDIRKNTSKTTIQYIVKMLKHFYFNDDSLSSKTVDGFIQFMTDSKFTYSVVKTATSISTHAPVFLYIFAFQGHFEEPFGPAVALNLTGVCHGKELGYLFYRNRLVDAHNHLNHHPRECATLTHMVRLWTNFARHGNPTPDKTDSLLAVKWLPVKGTLSRHLVINHSLSMDSGALWPERVALWNTAYILADHHTEDSLMVGLIILASVSSLALISLTFLLYDCLCAKRYMRL